MFKKKINILGIKRDTLFTLFFEFAMAILPSIINRSRKAKEEKSELWKVDIKYIDDNTYAFVCLLSFVESFFCAMLYLHTELKGVHFAIRVICIIVLIVMFIYFINTRKNVRLLLLKKNNMHRKILIDMPVVVSTIGMISTLCGNEVIQNISQIVILIIMSIGMSIFLGGMTCYKNSHADITLNTLEKILHIEADKIQKVGKWLIIRQGQEKRVLLFDTVVKIEYYGEAKYVLQNSIAEKLVLASN